ncbi:MAG: transposase [Clostridia bacterium]|nr:transposase [Clostridia bacterium]
MPYIQENDRNQWMFCSLDSMVDGESMARLIDRFVNSLDTSKYGFREAALDGRPSYDPKCMLKIYIYGSKNGIRSSRKLEKSCHVNVEVMWMTGGLAPDYQTISDFRKNNAKSLKKVFHEFNRRISGAVEWGFTSVDGSKFAASNAKDANFTKNKLDDRIQWLDAHTDEYMRVLDEMDKAEDEAAGNGLLTREEVESKLAEAQERLEKYKGYQKLMEETGASQLSLTDADARLMKSKNGFAVAYNPQTAVDSNTHLIRDFEMTNQVTDHGMLGKTMEGIRSETGDEILDVVADRGYEQPEDMARCLEGGIVPNVIPGDGRDGYELELPYEEDDGSADTSDASPEGIRKCLRAGMVPDAYQGIVTEIGVEEVSRKVRDGQDAEMPKSPYGTPEEMERRAKEGYFVRDPERNLVYCPNGEILRQKCVKRNGAIRYSNKNACKHCKNRGKCYHGNGGWKEIDFTKDCLEKPCRDWPKADGGGDAPQGAHGKKDSKARYEKVRVVRLFFKPDQRKMARRMCLSEHPFGTIKRAMGSDHFLLRGLEKVSGEFALMCLGYNFERAKNLLGFDKMMELMATE